MRVFCLPAVLSWHGEGVLPWSGSPTARLDPLGSPPARLALRGLAVVARRAQRTQTRPRIRIGHAPSDQRTARLREVVSHRRRTRTEHAPRMGVQVARSDALPPNPVSLGRSRAALLLGFPFVLGASATAGSQFGAAGDRVRGAGSAGHGVTSRQVGAPAIYLVYRLRSRRRWRGPPCCCVLQT